MAQPGAVGNLLLNLLSKAEQKRIAGELERVRTPARTLICDDGAPLREVRFPLSGVISSILVLKGGAKVEAAAVGREGMVGVTMLLGRDEPSPYRILQQIEGESLCAPMDRFQQMVDRSPAFRGLLTRYGLMLWRQCAQNAACNLHHTIEARMARWLLACGDRIAADDFAITQEFLSIMLGVRRQSINLTAGALQQTGAIAYRWGRIRIVDRAALEEIACECYFASKDVYQRMMKLPA